MTFVHLFEINLSKKMESMSWNYVKEKEKDVDEKCSLLREKITNAIDATIPKKMLPLSGKDKEWMTPITKSLIHERWNAYRTKNWTRYNFLKTKVKKEIIKAKRLWADNLKRTQQGLWKLAKVTRHGSRGDDGFGQIIDNQGGMNNVLQLLASSCSFFESRSVSELSSQDTKQYVDSLVDDNWSVVVTEEEVHRQICQLNVRKSSGDEKIPTTIYVSIANCIAEPLAEIYRSCDHQRQFPLAWKQGTTIPIPKTKPIDLEKVRFITLTSPLAKIFERIILKKAGDFFYSSYGSAQHGFRKHASTTTALIELTHCILSHYDNKEVFCIAVVNFDLSKAFDKVDHDLLMKRLRDCAFPTGLIKLLYSFLCNRSSRIRLRTSISESVRVTQGVPQGSVLGPLLFCVYTGDFSPKCESTKLIKYADDLSMVIPFKTTDSVTINQRIMDELSHLESWCVGKKLLLNATKSNVMFHTRKVLGIAASTLLLPVVDVVKVLGVYRSYQRIDLEHAL